MRRNNRHVLRARLRYLAAASATIAVGLSLQWVRRNLPNALADVLGDALWGLMIYWLLGAARPAVSRGLRATFAMLVCWLVEFSQLYHAPWIDAWRATTVGRLTLGSGFDARDLVAYGVGIAVGLGLEPAGGAAPRVADASRLPRADGGASS